MFTVSTLKALYLAHFSNPAADRVLYRDVRRRRVVRILQIGLISPQQSLRLIQLAQRAGTADAVRYVAVDLFEARPAEHVGLPLKEAYRLLKATGAQVQLVPGDPHSALTRSANALGQMDLVTISAEHDADSIANGWFYLPRLLAAGACVYWQASPSASAAGWRIVEHAEIEALAARHRPRRAA